MPQPYTMDEHRSLNLTDLRGSGRLAMDLVMVGARRTMLELLLHMKSINEDGGSFS